MGKVEMRYQLAGTCPILVRHTGARIRIAAMTKLPISISPLLVLIVSACSLPRGPEPLIEFTSVPPATTGGATRMEQIAGRVKGARPGQKIVLFAKSGPWWVQPFSGPAAFTDIQPDATFFSPTHLGTEYAALLVNPGYSPPRTTVELPLQGDRITAVARASGTAPVDGATTVPVRIQFSGHQWDVRQTASDSGGVSHENSSANVWTDKKGWLHLRISRQKDTWSCAEISLLRSLGYGTYSFVVQGGDRLEPGTVLGMFTWDDLEAGQNHREIDVELSQWGDPTARNAQFAIQPYYVPANVFRFDAPGSVSLTHSFRWEPGRVLFQTKKTGTPKQSRGIAEHIFTSGIPTPGGETVHINLYIYGKSRTAQRHEVEVVIEKFEHLP